MTTPVYEFDVPVERNVEELPSVKFKLNGESFTMRLPKVSVAVELVSLVDGDALREGVSIADAGARLTSVLWQCVFFVDEESPEPFLITQGEGDDATQVSNPVGGRARGQQRLVQRLRNPKDALDITDLADIFTTLVQAMFDRPTGPSRGSSGGQRDGGNDSAAGSSEAPDATSGS